MHKIAVISGAARGLGLELSQILVERNYLVFGISQSKEHWPEAKTQISNTKKFTLHDVDVTNEQNVIDYFSKLKTNIGQIDLLINNAGYVDQLTPLHQLTTDGFKKNIDTNLLSVFYMYKNSFPLLKQAKNALVINISSMAGKRAVPFLGAYSASKFGVLALSQVIAKENQKENNNIKCITVCPGGMNTLMRSKLFGEEDANNQQSAKTVADIIYKTVDNEISVESGGDIVIRDGKITQINKTPNA